MTLLGAFWLWLLVPFAVCYSRKARQEVEASDGRYMWSSRNPLHRPLLLWLLMLAASTALVLVMVTAGMYGDPAR